MLDRVGSDMVAYDSAALNWGRTRIGHTAEGDDMNQVLINPSPHARAFGKTMCPRTAPGSLGEMT